MQEIFRRKLNATEVERYFVYIERKHLDKLAMIQRALRIRFGKQEFKAIVDKQGRLFLGKFRDYITLSRECTIIFYSNPDGVFFLEVEGEKKI